MDSDALLRSRILVVDDEPADEMETLRALDVRLEQVPAGAASLRPAAGRGPGWGAGPRTTR